MTLLLFNSAWAELVLVKNIATKENISKVYNLEYRISPTCHEFNVIKKTNLVFIKNNQDNKDKIFIQLTKSAKASSTKIPKSGENIIGYKLKFQFINLFTQEPKHKLNLFKFATRKQNYPVKFRFGLMYDNLQKDETVEIITPEIHQNKVTFSLRENNQSIKKSTKFELGKHLLCRLTNIKDSKVDYKIDCQCVY